MNTLNKDELLSYQQRLDMTAIPLFSSEQVYNLESQWFAAGNDDFALMQQAAWQAAHWLQYQFDSQIEKSQRQRKAKLAIIWVGAGNNGGDGWLMAHYLTQFGWQVQVVAVAAPSSKLTKKAKAVYCQKQDADTIFSLENLSLENDILAQTGQAKKADIQDLLYQQCQHLSRAESIIHIDALFGIGLDRVPAGNYQQAIETINQMATHLRGTVVAVDIPSGLVASTGQVFESVAVRADYTLCMLARKVGLHIKSGRDYAGEVIDIPLIPYTYYYAQQDSQQTDQVTSDVPCAWLQSAIQPFNPRQHDSHKGSYGHVLIIGGNYVDGSQGMGGAAILAASAALAAGVGKLTVACHQQFHGALITALPNAMSIDLMDTKAVKAILSQVDVMAIGMGLGRNNASEKLFTIYLEAAIAAKKDLLIDADGLYHLASLAQTKKQSLRKKFMTHIQAHDVYFTPHSGEAARLLDCEVAEVESDRITAIQQLGKQWGGSWLLKGAGSIVWSEEECHICAAGNAGMATAGMGDVLSGLAAALLAQTDLPQLQRSLLQAVMVHAIAGDELASHVGHRGVQAKDMADFISQVMSTSNNF
ncbi:NAD(P)H-hydrate dehydratase [Psychrobacter sp. I-STPA10]|uniref:NAD(P)H-hydrate dehydratase n=1 Tax=Psychrobacter sp. I-STPA10 TaxID=2585769 RepID=UPI001E36C65A|nr:NAD(P)H-hydrate dehydratase [Psychrobacter sp. I-STPA10]